MTQKITILCVGSLKEAYWRDAAAEYAKRLGRFATVDIVEVAEKKLPANAGAADEQIVVEAESRLLAGKIVRSPRTLVAALDIAGKPMTSPDFASWLSDRASYGKTDIVFLIGGSLGLSEELLRQADVRISFSSMTFPHQLMRVILLEQLYRAMKINRNEPYHK